MRAASFSARSCSAFTTFSGALARKPGLESLLLSFSSSPLFFFSSLAMRAFSFSRSTSSARGMPMRAAWVMTVTTPRAASSLSLPRPLGPVTVTSLAYPSRLRKGMPAVKMACSPVAMVRWAFLEGGTFISDRRVRTAFTASMRSSTAFSSWGKARSWRYWGQDWSMRNFTSLPASWGRACQISSVRKGMKGCSSLRMSVRT